MNAYECRLHVALFSMYTVIQGMVLDDIKTNYAPHKNESCHICMSYVTRMNAYTCRLYVAMFSWCTAVQGKVLDVMNESYHIWMNHATLGWGMSHIQMYMCVHCRWLWFCGVYVFMVYSGTRQGARRHEWVMPHMIESWQIKESCHIFEGICVYTAGVYVLMVYSSGTRQSAWRHEWIIQHMNELCHIWMSHVTCMNAYVCTLQVSMFSWYTVMQGKVLDAATAFTALAWIGQLRWYVYIFIYIYIYMCICV